MKPLEIIIIVLMEVNRDGTGVQEYRSTEVQEYRSTEVQEYRSTGVECL